MVSDMFILRGSMFSGKVASELNGGTPQKKPVTIPRNKCWQFNRDLLRSSHKRYGIDCGLNFYWWKSDENITNCSIIFDGRQYVGVTHKHPDDVENEYVGKTFSFNRAFDKLAKVVLGIDEKTIVGIALGTSKKFEKVDVETSIGIYRSTAAEDIEKGDQLYAGYGGCVYPVKSEQTSKESDDITITMSRIHAEELRKHLREYAVGYDIYSKLGRSLSMSK